ncbi:MAG: glycosyltransferase family 2 protein [Candidatus Latescibacteria bacterium]|nr:glycosyltransferase family 2 protein [Candidatus Latescibacterota bacterium]
MPRVSLVIATWNRRSDLYRTLVDYQRQTYRDFETIVVDNGSTDGTADMVAQTFPDVQLIRLEQNTGIAGYNTGITHAAGEFIVVSDNDSSLEHDGIRKLVEKFDRFPRVAIIACEVVEGPGGTIYDWYLRAVDRSHPPDDGYPSHLFIGAGAGFRKRVLDEVGLYPEEFFMYMNEVDLATRVLAAGHDVRFCPDIQTYHRHSETGRSRDLNRYYAFRNTIWYYWKYLPVSVAFGRCLIRVPFDVVSGLLLGTSPLALGRALGAAIIGLPRILRSRQPVPSALVRRVLGGRSELATLYGVVHEWLRRKRQVSPGRR